MTGVLGAPYPAYLLGWGLGDFLSGLALSCDPPNLHLLSSWDYRSEPPVNDNTEITSQERRLDKLDFSKMKNF
jgi:hypothetical protein